MIIIILSLFLQSFVVLGAPGADTYRGQGFLYQVSDGVATGPQTNLYSRSNLLISTAADLYESKFTTYEFV